MTSMLAWWLESTANLQCPVECVRGSPSHRMVDGDPTLELSAPTPWVAPQRTPAPLLQVGKLIEFCQVLMFHEFYMFFYWSIYNTCMDPYIPIWHPSAMKCSWLRLLQACICLTWRRVFIRATSINVLPQEACVSLRPWQDKSQAARETAHKDWCKSTSTYIYLHHATEKQCSRLLKQHRLIILILVCVVWLTLRWIGSLLRGSFKHPKQTLRIFQDKGVVPGTAGSWYNTGSKPKKFNAPVILTGAHDVIICWA